MLLEWNCSLLQDMLLQNADLQTNSLSADSKKRIQNSWGLNDLSTYHKGLLQTVVHLFLVRIQPQHLKGFLLFRGLLVKARLCLNKSIVLMLCYNLNSHVILPSLGLVSFIRTLEVFKSSLCKLSQLQRGRWKILLGVSHDVKVQVHNYLKEKSRS